MRWLILLLLVINLVYFGLELDRDTQMKISNSRHGIKAPAGVTQLKKISELESTPGERSGETLLSHDQAETLDGELQETFAVPGDDTAGDLVSQLPGINPAIVAGTPASATCFSFGPIPDRKKAVALYDWFRSKNITVEMNNREENAEQMFWIYLTPVASRESAISVLNNLKDRGIRDYRLISKGELRNAISLGLFSSQGAVDNRLSELHGKGFKPVVVPYTDVRTVYLVEVFLMKGTGLVEEVFNGFPSGFNSIPVKCPQTG